MATTPPTVNDMKKKFKSFAIFAYIFVAIIAFALILIFPSSREVFGNLSTTHPFIMGFAKFAILATAGELLGMYIRTSKISLPSYIAARFIIWGIIGVWITFMMKVYSFAVADLMQSGMLPGGENSFLRALYTSVIMNTTFGPTFMAAHKISDKIFDVKAAGDKATMQSVIGGIDWRGFFGFTILKTVPIFWIPAHTVTFMLPSQYQVIMAAALSVALGIILSISNRTAKEK